MSIKHLNEHVGTGVLDEEQNRGEAYVHIKYGIWSGNSVPRITGHLASRIS